MTFRYLLLLAPLLVQAALGQAPPPPPAAPIGANVVVGSNLSVDVSGVRPGPITVDSTPATVTVHWRDEKSRAWEAVFSLSAGARQPLISAVSVEGRKVIEGAQPWYRCETGKKGGAAGWDEFFDFPPDAPEGTRAFRATFNPKSVHVRTIGDRVEVSFDGMRMGIFQGSLRYIFYPGSRLIEQQAAMTTQEPDVAYFYDAGLRMRSTADQTVGDLNTISHLSYFDTAGKFQTITSRRPDGAEMNTLVVRYRTVAAKLGVGSVAVFPAPHQYMIPRDWSTNMGYVWYSVWRGDVSLGIRQYPDDAVYNSYKNYPWFNAPPGTQQEMRMFLLVSDQDMRQTLDSVLRYTHGDRFPKLPGYITVSAHYHEAFFMKARQYGFNWEPPFKIGMKDIGLDCVILNDFHSDGHPRDPGQVRLQEQYDYFRATRAQSGKDFLMIPAEEPNVYLGGHWDLVFPKPVYWHMVRPPDQPFIVQDPKYGTVYNVGNEKELWEMVQREHGHVYTAHPRTKSSFGYPDKYVNSFFFKDPQFFGVGWKATPMDLSSPSLSERSFKTIDDMNNLGLRKRWIGEVDTFQGDPTDELYGHMNVMYVRLPAVPSYDNYGQVLDTLAKGDFFHTTGEILIPDVEVRGAGEVVTASGTVDYTFPLRIAEIVWGDGTATHHQTFALEDTHEFGNQRFTWKADAPGWKWARLAIWDAAGNGAFTTPTFR